jgi:hypothetical protein
VSQWPGQESHKGESKIPTLVYYNQSGKVDGNLSGFDISDVRRKAVSFGAEALKPEIIDQAELEGWQLARQFKLHLHPDSMKQRHQLKIQRKSLGGMQWKILNRVELQLYLAEFL